MKFTKMHGCGNDFVVINCTGGLPLDIAKEELSSIAIMVSDRKNGIGSDGMILIYTSTCADFQMVIYNADGTIAEMCGNGIRCLGKYVYENGLTQKTEISVETGAGIRYLSLQVKDDMVVAVKVNMGEPIFQPILIPVQYSGQEPVVMDYELKVDERSFNITCISMGNPHTILFVDDLIWLDVKELGSKIEKHEFFPNRTNVEFVYVIDRNNIEMRVWERGSGETFACGTGSCASAIAAILHNYCEDQVTVHLLGGNLRIDYDKEENIVYLTGPAVIVYEGEINP